MGGRTRVRNTRPDPHVAHLYRLINQLPDSDRTIILMHIDGLSTDEIAAFLGKTKSQTYSLLHSIRNKLRRLHPFNQRNLLW